MDTSKYKPNNSKMINVAFIKSLQEQERRGAIISPGEWAEYKDEDEELVKKPKIAVSVKGVTYEWVLNQTTNERLGEEIGSFDTNDWLNCIVKFLIDKRGDREFVTATLIDKPTMEQW